MNYDVVRGVINILKVVLQNPEQTQAAGLTAFGTDGFTVVSNGAV